MSAEDATFEIKLLAADVRELAPAEINGLKLARADVTPIVSIAVNASGEIEWGGSLFVRGVPCVRSGDAMIAWARSATRERLLLEIERQAADLSCCCSECVDADRLAAEEREVNTEHAAALADRGEVRS